MVLALHPLYFESWHHACVSVGFLILLVELQMKEKAKKLFGDFTAKQMFPNAESMYKFHSENLLPQLQNRLHHW